MNEETRDSLLAAAAVLLLAAAGLALSRWIGGRYE